MPRATLLKINSVWSSHGHVFADSGEAEHDDNGAVIGYYVDCDRCGAHYVLKPTPEGFSDGAYVARDGSEPTYCTGDTEMIHGDPRENGHSLDCDDGCEHCNRPCNCIRCTG